MLTDTSLKHLMNIKGLEEWNLGGCFNITTVRFSLFFFLLLFLLGGTLSIYFYSSKQSEL